jgi:hypothetical protein
MVALFAGTVTMACVGASPMRASAPDMPVAAGQAKCQIAKGQDNPLVTEWPASEKANLEARLARGAVVVAFLGCEMRMLPECFARGSYSWRRTTTSTDVLEIRNADDLYAKLPLGALSLESELQRSGRLAVQTTVSGQLVLQGLVLQDIASSPGCVGATHVVGQLSVGAFKLRSGGAMEVRAGAGSSVFGGGVGTSSAETVVREAGDSDKCRLSTDLTPHAECSSPVQVFLQPLPEALADRGPPGTRKVTFLSAEGDKTWNVVVGDRKLCETPCERWVDPVMPYAMRAEAGFLQQDHVVEVPDLRDVPHQGTVRVRAYSRSNAGLAGGVVATTFGGLGTAAGIVFLALGCSSEDRAGMCTAGAITLPLGGLLTAGGIWLMVTSGAHAEVLPGHRPQQFGVGGAF